MSQPWILEADSIDTLNINNYLYQNTLIKKFLHNDNIFFIVGSKGLGKTLLLKKKRYQYYSKHRGGNSSELIIIPSDLELDIPRYERIFDQEIIENFLSKISIWKTLWMVSIYSSILYHHIARTKDEKLKDEILDSKFDILNIILHQKYNEQKYSPINPSQFLIVYLDIFLSLNPGERNKLYDEFLKMCNFLKILVNNNIRYGCAIFIDRVDETLLEHLTRTLDPSITGWISPKIWYAAQVGLIDAIDTITIDNHHIKIYTSIRKEVWDNLHTPGFQQLRGKSIELDYTIQDLKMIFIKNIKLEEYDNYVKPQSSDYIEKFIGLKEIYTIKDNPPEDVFMYIYRHTLHRPRDIVEMGRELSNISPDERARMLKTIVNETAANMIRAQYLEQVRPFVDINFEELFQAIETNILTKNDILNICNEYRNSTGEDIDCNRVN